MVELKKSMSEDERDKDARRQPVFSSQRFDRPALTSQTSARQGGNLTADELITRLLNQGSPLSRNASQRSTASDTIQREIAFAEASFNPTDLFQEGLDEWHDRSLSVQLLKKSQSLSASKMPSAFRRNSSSKRSARVSDASLGRRLSDASQGRRLSDASQGKPPSDAFGRKDGILPCSQQLSRESYHGTRHRYNFDFKRTDLLTTTNEDGSAPEIPDEYIGVLNNAPYSALIHLVMLYHQVLLKHGFIEDASRISRHLADIEIVDMQEIVAELTGVDLLLRDGLLKYLMSISPYIPSIPKQVVKFKDVGFTGTVQLASGYQSMYTQALHTMKGPFNKSPLEKVTLLRGLTGYFMPGTLTLVMGTLGSGVSVIHSVLSGRANGSGKTTTGSITYNGRSLKEIKGGRLISLVHSTDIHFPQLTVRETLEFARECSQYYRSHHYGEELKEIVGEALKEGQDPKLETNLSMMGLKRVAERPVGNTMVPSITEAERHRLTVAEMLAGTYAVYFFDQLNKGMDESVTFDLVTGIRIATRIRGSTVVASLNQPSQTVFDQFDRIIMLDRGHVVYQGPRQDVLPYFETLGYVKPRQLTIPEFLEEVTTTDGTRYLQPGFPKLDVEGFAAEYKKSDNYKDILRVVNSPEVVEDVWVEGSQPLGVTLVQSHPNTGEGIVEPLTTLVSSINEKGGSLVDVSMNHTGTVYAGDEVVAVGGSTGSLNYVKVGDTSKEGVSLSDKPSETIRLQLERPLADERAYDLQFSRDFVQDPWAEIKLLVDRDIKTTWRNKLSLMIRSVQVLVLSCFIGFITFRVHPNDNQLNFNLLRGVFFLSLLNMTAFNLGQLPGLVEDRNIFYKQNAAYFYRPSSYGFAKLVGSLPFSMAEATTWSVIVYFLSGFSIDQGGWHFFVFYIIISLTVLNGAAMVRCFAAFAPDQVAANGMIGFMVSIFIVFAGFLVPRFEVKHYWYWAYYVDPLQWGITGLMINEFNSQRYSRLCGTLTTTQITINLAQCANRPEQTIGHAYLAKGQFYTSNNWIGVSIGCLVGWFILWNSLTLLALKNIRHVPLMVITPTAEAKFLKKTDSIIARDLEQLGPKISLVASPVTLSWHELSYDILIPEIGKTLTVLSYVSGWAEPGEMVGLMGATGAGKTMLLNCLAGRQVQTGRIGGQILVNGHFKNSKAFSRVSGYVDRMEAYSPYMTIREAISFSSEVMLGRTTTYAERKVFVDEIIELMELRSVESSLVKSLGASYLTSAEATRLRVATELARNPSVLFIDSPTKNLDGRSALHMVRILKKIADSGRVVIAAMPMPSQRIVNCFTSLQILKRGGETVYWGPVGKDGDLVKAYFEAIPGTPKCPPNVCVTAFAVDAIGDGVQERKANKDYAFEYRVNELALHNHIQLQALRRGKQHLGPEINDESFGSSYFIRARTVFEKLQLYFWRNISYSWGRLFSSIVLSILFGSIFFQQNWNTTPGMNTKASGIFISTGLQCLSNAQSVIPQVFSNRAMYRRDKSGGQLNVFLYSVAWICGEIPYLAISTLVYAAIFCGMSGTATTSASNFFRYWFVLYELTLCITFFGMMLASASKIPQITATLLTLFVGFWVATVGLVIPKKKILPEFVWVFWTNPLQYALQALTSIAFYCDVEAPDCLSNGLNALCETSAAACPQCRCQRLHDTGKFVWSTIRFNRTLPSYGNVKYYMIVLLGFIVLFRAATFAINKILSRRI